MPRTVNGTGHRLYYTVRILEDERRQTIVVVAAAVDNLAILLVPVTRTVNGTGHTGPSEFCATSI